ncbi:hypothetical protein DMC30DRAFT_396986, partial [Rhodotorula diobovata]
HLANKSGAGSLELHEAAARSACYSPARLPSCDSSQQQVQRPSQLPAQCSHMGTIYWHLPSEPSSNLAAWPNGKASDYDLRSHAFVSIRRSWVRAPSWSNSLFAGASRRAAPRFEANALPGHPGTAQREGAQPRSWCTLPAEVWSHKRVLMPPGGKKKASSPQAKVPRAPLDPQRNANPGLHTAQRRDKAQQHAASRQPPSPSKYTHRNRRQRKNRFLRRQTRLPCAAARATRRPHRHRRHTGVDGAHLGVGCAGGRRKDLAATVGKRRGRLG